MNSTDDAERLAKIDKHFNTGDYDRAFKETVSYTEEYPGSYQGWCLLGWVYLKKDDTQMAAVCFNKSLKINPKSDNAYVGKGVLHRKAGDLNAARKSYQKAIDLVPENAEALSSLLVIEILEKNYATAVECGEKAWEIRKDSATIAANLAVAHHYLNNEAKKQQYYKAAKKLGYPQMNGLDQIFAGTLVIE